MRGHLVDAIGGILLKMLINRGLYLMKQSKREIFHIPSYSGSKYRKKLKFERGIFSPSYGYCVSCEKTSKVELNDTIIWLPIILVPRSCISIHDSYGCNAENHSMVKEVIYDSRITEAENLTL